MNLLPTDIDLDASADTLRRPEGHTQNFNGRKIWKSVDDLARHGVLLERDRPELLIETGTRWAGFATWAAVKYGIDVITIDISPVRVGIALDPRITQIVANSISPLTVEKVAHLAHGRRTMVVLDADHHSGHVVNEVIAYAPMVSVGCAFVVEDTLADYVGGWVASQIGNQINAVGGPMAGANLLVSDPRFERDLEIENMSAVSHSPAGWWRRVA